MSCDFLLSAFKFYFSDKTFQELKNTYLMALNYDYIFIPNEAKILKGLITITDCHLQITKKYFDDIQMHDNIKEILKKFYKIYYNKSHTGTILFIAKIKNISKIKAMEYLCKNEALFLTQIIFRIIIKLFIHHPDIIQHTINENLINALILFIIEMLEKYNFSEIKLIDNFVKDSNWINK